MRWKILIAASGLLAVCGASAQTRSFTVTVTPQQRPEGYEKTEVSKATIGVNPIRLWMNASIDPDCQANGKVSLTILKPPQHGEVVIHTEPFFMAFPQSNPRSACNTQKIPGNQAIYTAEAGYVGQDHLVLEGFSPEGHVRRISVNIDVR